MADIELVIKLSKEDYKRLKEYKNVPFCSLTSRVYEAIAKGTPLPKGHGRIVDISQMTYMKTLNKAIHNRSSWVEAIRRIKNSAPTIVEADKESEDKE